MSVFSEKNHKIPLENCLICFEKISDIENVNSLNNLYLECNQCKKCYHSECIDLWDKYRNKCPHCRYTIEEFDFYYNAFPREDFLIHYHFIHIYLAIYSIIFLVIIFLFIGILLYYYLI